MSDAYEELLCRLRERPALYAQSTHPFWDDEHISKSMLQSHLDPDVDGASRKLRFIESSVGWITDFVGGADGKALLDLGCGPGLYDALLSEKGFEVTGVDLSRRSIAYAKKKAAECGQEIEYLCQNYLSIDFKEAFDVSILVYCDFGVLSPTDRAALLKIIYRALKPGGTLILDAWNTPYLRAYRERETVSYNKSGFWADAPHAVIERDMLYKETSNTLEQYLILSKTDLKCYNIWNQAFTPETLSAEMARAGFTRCACFDDIAGAPLTRERDTICITAKKERVGS